MVHLYPNKFGTKWHQNHQSPMKGVFILPCEMQHAYRCYDQRLFCHVSLNVIIIILFK